MHAGVFVFRSFDINIITDKTDEKKNDRLGQHDDDDDDGERTHNVSQLPSN